MLSTARESPPAECCCTFEMQAVVGADLPFPLSYIIPYTQRQAVQQRFSSTTPNEVCSQTKFATVAYLTKLSISHVQLSCAFRNVGYLAPVPSPQRGIPLTRAEADYFSIRCTGLPKRPIGLLPPSLRAVPRGSISWEKSPAALTQCCTAMCSIT